MPLMRAFAGSDTAEHRLTGRVCRVPIWQPFLLLAKLASISSVSTALEGMNNLLTQHVVEDAAVEEQANSNRGSSDILQPKSLSLFR